MKYGLQGRYKVYIVNAKTGVVRYESPWGTNLITNNGMNRIAIDKICNTFLYGIAGIGTKTNDVVSTDSGTTATCDVAGNVILSSGFGTYSFDLIAPGDFNNIIKWDNTGFEGMLTTLTDGKHALVTPAPVVPQTGSFIIYRTNWSTLESEAKRTSDYLGFTPYCSTSLFGNLLVHQRTWNFSAEIVATTYHEMGVGWSTTLNDTAGGGTVFARFLLHAVTAVNIGEQLRLTYQLRIIVDPSVDRSKSASITGWPVAPSVNTNGVERIQYLGLSSVAANGNTSFFDAGGNANEPSVVTDTYVYLSTSATANATIGSAVDRQTAFTHAEKAVTSPTYSSNSYHRVKEVTFQTGEANSTLWRSMGIGFQSSPAQNNAQNFLFDQAQTKTITKTLNLQFFFDWQRVLSTASV